MKILLAADGSSYTKKALGWLVTNQSFAQAGDELIVLNVQPPVPPRVRSALGADVVKGYHEAFKDCSELVYGGTNKERRQAAFKRVVNDPGCLDLFANIRAAGTGIRPATRAPMMVPRTTAARQAEAAGEGSASRSCSSITRSR